MTSHLVGSVLPHELGQYGPFLINTVNGYLSHKIVVVDFLLDPHNNVIIMIIEHVLY